MTLTIYGSFCGPTEPKALSEGAFVHGKSLRSLLNRHSFAVNFDEPISAAIIGLLFNSCPAAVPRLVVTVVINAINFMRQGRPTAHVCIKAFKCLPLLADSYAAAAVVWVASRIRIIATAFHTCPRVVFRGAEHAVAAISQRRPIGGKTPATSSGFDESSGAHGSHSTAITATYPHAVGAVSQCALLDNDKAPEAFARFKPENNHKKVYQKHGLVGRE